jgi:phosphohistidine phosphatase
MLLALIRHGIAEDTGPHTGYRDEPRHLTEVGITRMSEAARGIARLGLHPKVILSSPLARCVQTAEILAASSGSAVRLHEVMRPGASTPALLDVLAEYPDADCIAVCGHQPDLSLITAALTGGSRVDFRRGTLCVIDLPHLRAHSGTLTGLYPPTVLRQLGSPDQGTATR